MGRNRRIMLVNPGKPKRGTARWWKSIPEDAEPFEEDADLHMQYARGHLVSNLYAPYLATAAMALKFIPQPGFGTLGVDSSWRLYYDPDLVVYWPVEDLAAVIEHEIWHLLREHAERAQENDVDNSTAHLWNYAADAEIHSDEKIVQRLKKIPGGENLVTPESMGLPPNQFAEWYYLSQGNPEDWPKPPVPPKLTDRPEDIEEEEGNGGKPPKDAPICKPPCKEHEICVDIPGMGPTCVYGEPDPNVDAARYPWEVFEDDDDEDYDIEENRYGLRRGRSPQRNSYGHPGFGRGPRGFRTGYPWGISRMGKGGGPGPKGPVGPPKCPCEPEDWTSEMDPVRGISGSAADGLPRNWEDAPTQEVVNDAEKKRIRRDTAVAIQGAKGRGTDPGKWAADWAAETLSPGKVDWRDELEAAIDEAIDFVSGELDLTWTKVSRRQPASRRVMLPGTWSPVPEVAIVLDTSGSMFTASYNPNSSAARIEGQNYQTLLNAALNEIGVLLEEHGSNVGVQIFVTDAVVHSAERVFDLEDLQLAGGGGTDMDVGLTAAANADPEPNILICLTDGYTPWPQDPPPIDAITIIGIVGSTEAELARTWPVPPWADMVIFIDDL